MYLAIPKKLKQSHKNFIRFSAYEIWFKQILYEIDSVRELFLGKANMQQILENIANNLKDVTIDGGDESSATNGATSRRKKREDMCSISEDAVYHHEVDDAHMLEINKRLNRVVMILKVNRNFLYWRTKIKLARNSLKIILMFFED